MGASPETVKRAGDALAAFRREAERLSGFAGFDAELARHLSEAVSLARQAEPQIGAVESGRQGAPDDLSQIARAIETTLEAVVQRLETLRKPLSAVENLRYFGAEFRSQVSEIGSVELDPNLAALVREKGLPAPGMQIVSSMIGGQRGFAYRMADGSPMRPLSGHTGRRGDLGSLTTDQLRAITSMPRDISDVYPGVDVGGLGRGMDRQQPDLDPYQLSR